LASASDQAGDPQDGSVVMFDLTSFKVLKRIAAAEDADAIIYDPASQRVFTFNRDAHSSTVIDPVQRTIVATVPIGTGVDGAGYDAASADASIRRIIGSTWRPGSVRRPRTAAGGHPSFPDSFSLLVIERSPER
jgi:DNA-binding beta-propeller fold protein YncE